MIDPTLQAILDAMNASGFTMPDPLEAVAMRALMDQPFPAPPVDVAERRDVVFDAPAGPIAARLYHPRPGTMLPVTLFFHGGGWVLGNLETHDRLAAGLAAGTDCAVLSVAYRLAPENPFPAGLDDCTYVAENLASLAPALGIDARRFAVAGDSAGGNLAAAVALRLRAGPLRPVHQLLMYPVLASDLTTPSYRNAPEDGFLTTKMMQWFWQQYVANPATAGPLAAPLRAPTLVGLPPATIILAGVDPLHDEGEQYAAALRAAGVTVTLRDFPTAIHGFVSFLGLAPIADEAMALAAAELRKALTVPSG